MTFLPSPAFKTPTFILVTPFACLVIPCMLSAIWDAAKRAFAPSCGAPAAWAERPVICTSNFEVASSLFVPHMMPLLVFAWKPIWPPNRYSTPSSTPAASIATAPLVPSSAVWKINLNLPFRSSKFSAISFATPRPIDMWPSCPQACVIPAISAPKPSL